MICDMNYRETALKQKLKENTCSAVTFLNYLPFQLPLKSMEFSLKKLIQVVKTELFNN